MTKVCGNLLGGISRSLKQNGEWRMELLDETKKPVFRISPGGGDVGLSCRLDPVPFVGWKIRQARCRQVAHLLF
jgi:hypothetical protein